MWNTTCFLPWFPAVGERLESAEPLGAEAGVSSTGVVCPLPSVIPPKIVPYQRRLFLCLSRNKACSADHFCEPFPLWFLLLAKAQLPTRWRKVSLLGHAPSFLSQNNVIQGHTELLLYPGSSCLVSTPCLGPGEQGQSPRTLYFYSSLGQHLWEWMGRNLA